MNWFTRISSAIYREYDRRIKRASLIAEYGTHHDHSSHGESEDDGEIEIVNMPRGAVLTSGDDEEVEIVNVPRGAALSQEKPGAED